MLAESFRIITCHIIKNQCEGIECDDITTVVVNITFSIPSFLFIMTISFGFYMLCFGYFRRNRSGMILHR